MNLLNALHRACQEGERLFMDKLDADDTVTVRQGILLAAIKDNPNGSQTVLVEQTGIDRSTLADMCRRMVKKGWCTRRRTKEDARAYAVKITPDGEQALRVAINTAKKAEADLLLTWPKVKALL